MRKFHVQTKAFVKRAFVINNNEYIEMTRVELPGCKIFNGIAVSQETKIKLLANQFETKYKLTELLSKNISDQKNIIIINTPKQMNIKDVIIDVPKPLQELFKLPAYLVMLDCNKYKIDILSGISSPGEML